MILLLGTVFGYLLARRLFHEPCRWLAAAVAPLLGLFSALLSGGLLLQWMPWPAWMALTGVLFCVGIGILRSRPSPSNFRPPRALLLVYAVPALALVLVFCWFHQAVGMVVDGDFFIHGANVGLFARGYLPPVNPFLGMPMHGHYGRDLAIAIFVRDTGLGLLTSEWVLTTILQALSFLVLMLWLRRETDDDLAGVLGSAFAFFGMNFSAYAGLSELLANNNPLAFCLLILIGWALFHAQRSGPPVWIAAGLLLGLDAIIYETHFGVIGLSLIVLMRGRILEPASCDRVTTSQRGTAFRAMVAVGLLALITAGSLSGVLRSTARGAPESGSEQTIRVRLFKKELFNLRTDNLRPSRAFETKARPWRADFSASSEYRPIWSRAILNTFWYPVWLLPFSTLFLAWSYLRRAGSEAGLWWASVAWLSLLAPALADFGFFEAETARWLVVVALGAAVSLALALATLWRSFPSAGIPVTLALVAMSSVGLQVSFKDMVNAYQHPGQSLPVGRPGLPPGHGLLPDPGLALQYHYGISADVLQAARWIRDHSKLGEHFLCDSWDLPPNARGALIGATGCLPAMEAQPPVWSRSVNSYQTNLQQRGFWATGDLLRLDPRVDWLLVSRSGANFGKADFENAHARAYRVADRPAPPRPGTGPFEIRFDRKRDPGGPFPITFEGPMGCLLELRFTPLGGQEFVADENIQSTASAPHIVFVAPYAAGEYRVEARLSPQADWKDFGTFAAGDSEARGLESAVPWEEPRPAR